MPTSRTHKRSSQSNTKAKGKARSRRRTTPGPSLRDTRPSREHSRSGSDGDGESWDSAGSYSSLSEDENSERLRKRSEISELIARGFPRGGSDTLQTRNELRLQSPLPLQLGTSPTIPETSQRSPSGHLAVAGPSSVRTFALYTKYATILTLVTAGHLSKQEAFFRASRKLAQPLQTQAW
jgi:hypothetical protein